MQSDNGENGDNVTNVVSENNNIAETNVISSPQDSSGALESSDEHLADILSLSGPFRSNKWRAKLY